MIRFLIAIPVAAYLATAMMVGYQYWASLPQRDIDRAAYSAAMHNPLTELAARLGADRLIRPAWAAFHGLLWPLSLWHSRGDH